MRRTELGNDSDAIDSEMVSRIVNDARNDLQKSSHRAVGRVCRQRDKEDREDHPFRSCVVDRETEQMKDAGES